jgi:hypothetical protein
MYPNTDNKNDYMSYHGPFSMPIISALGKYLTDNLQAPEIVKMRLYKVFIELTQNVALYSSNRIWSDDYESIGIGSLEVFNHENCIQCTTFNQVLPEHGIILEKNCNQINQLNESGLKREKEKLRKEASMHDTGAHIGLISMKLISRNPLDFKIISKPEAGEIYFHISTQIQKEVR